MIIVFACISYMDFIFSFIVGTKSFCAYDDKNIGTFHDNFFHSYVCFQIVLKCRNIAELCRDVLIP